jgi:hypothetical protein
MWRHRHQLALSSFYFSVTPELREIPLRSRQSPPGSIRSVLRRPSSASTTAHLKTCMDGSPRSTGSARSQSLDLGIDHLIKLAHRGGADRVRHSASVMSSTRPSASTYLFPDLLLPGWWAPWPLLSAFLKRYALPTRPASHQMCEK